MLQTLAAMKRSPKPDKSKAFSTLDVQVVFKHNVHVKRCSGIWWGTG